MLGAQPTFKNKNNSPNHYPSCPQRDNGLNVIALCSAGNSVRFYIQYTKFNLPYPPHLPELPYHIPKFQVCISNGIEEDIPEY